MNVRKCNQGTPDCGYIGDSPHDCAGRVATLERRLAALEQHITTHEPETSDERLQTLLVAWATNELQRPVHSVELGEDYEEAWSDDTPGGGYGLTVSAWAPPEAWEATRGRLLRAWRYDEATVFIQAFALFIANQANVPAT